MKEEGADSNLVKRITDLEALVKDLHVGSMQSETAASAKQIFQDMFEDLGIDSCTHIYHKESED